MGDGRLDLGQVCVLTGRFDEAREWFERARVVLDEEGSRSLRAIVDYVEAESIARRGMPAAQGRVDAPRNCRADPLRRFSQRRIGFTPKRHSPIPPP